MESEERVMRVGAEAFLAHGLAEDVVLLTDVWSVLFGILRCNTGGCAVGVIWNVEIRYFWRMYGGGCFEC